MEIVRVNILPSYARYSPARFRNVKCLTIGNLAKFSIFDPADLSFAGANIEEICVHFYIDRRQLLIFADYVSRFRKLKRITFHLMALYRLDKNDILLVLHDSLQVILANNQLTEIVVQLYRQNRNLRKRNPVAMVDADYLDTIKMVFGAVAQWSVTEDANCLVFTKEQN